MNALLRAESRWLVGVVLTLALGVRLLAALWWQAGRPADAPFHFGDSHSYWHLARAVARGEPYEYGSPDLRVFRTPGYPLVLAPLFLTSDEPPVLAARFLGALLGVATVGLSMVLARQLFDPPTAVLAGAALAVYPGAIATSVFVLSEAAFCPLLVGQLSLWIAAERADSPTASFRWAAAAGLVAGAATLMRPSWLLFTPLAIGVSLVLVLFANRRTHRSESSPRRWWIAGGLLAGLIVALLPWWVRNAVVVGRFVPTTLQVGASLYDGLHAGATGGSDMRFVDQFRDELRTADALAEQPPTEPFEVRLDRRLKEASLVWAREHPGRVLQLAAIKFWRMWSPWPNAAEFRSRWGALVIAVGYAPLLLLSLAGAWSTLRRGFPYVLCVLPAAYLTLLHMVFVSSLRYREPAMAPLAVLAAAALVTLVTLLRRRRGVRPAIGE